MNSCHEEGVRDRNRAGIEAASGAGSQLRFQLDSCREHPPRDMSSSETGHYIQRDAIIVHTSSSGSLFQSSAISRETLANVARSHLPSCSLCNC
eukprot:gene26214-biopygen14943